jgi:hypothetical protein
MANHDDLAKLRRDIMAAAEQARRLGHDRVAMALDAARDALDGDVDDATATRVAEQVTGGRPPDE